MEEPKVGIDRLIQQETRKHILIRAVVTAILAALVMLVGAILLAANIRGYYVQVGRNTNWYHSNYTMSVSDIKQYESCSKTPCSYFFKVSFKCADITREYYTSVSKHDKLIENRHTRATKKYTEQSGDCYYRYQEYNDNQRVYYFVLDIDNYYKKVWTATALMPLGGVLLFSAMWYWTFSA